MKSLLLDQGLPRGAVALLAERGFDAVHAADLGLARAPDSAILARAREEGRTVITLDSDFHMLLALSRATGPSVIRIRIEGLDHIGVSDRVVAVFESHGADLDGGAVISVTERATRVRKLPLGDELN